MRTALRAAALALLTILTGCAVAPRAQDRAAFVIEADQAMTRLADATPHLAEALDDAAGYAVFPRLLQWGTLFGGGSFGRAVVRDATGEQVGWAMLNNASLGLQAGIQDCAMIVVFDDLHAFERHTRTTLDASAAGVAVGLDHGRAARASSDGGLTIYQASHSGLLLGANVGLDLFRYAPLEPGDPSLQRSVPLVQH